jgi:hypothetical protein
MILLINTCLFIILLKWIFIAFTIEMDLSVVGKMFTCCRKFKVFQEKTLRTLLLWKKLADKQGEAPSDTR